MSSVEVMFLVLVTVNIVALIYFIFFKKDKRVEDTQGLLLLQQQMQSLTRTLDERMGETTERVDRSVRAQMVSSQQLMRDIHKEMHERLMVVTKGVAEVGESSKQVFSIAEQLQNLEKVLKHQKQRGNLGEASLRLALENILPPEAYTTQYYFKDGDAVDAVIHTKDGIIPVDAKFSLDNYRRLVDEKDEVYRVELEKEFRNDLKKRIEETAKYIRPKEHTLPFAFMFIPAEAIYYDLLVNEVGATKTNTRSMIEYAYHDKHVIIVSPTTFAAYLQSVLYGFRAFKIEESAKTIGKHVEMLSRHLKAYEGFIEKVGNSLGTTVNHYNAAQKEFGKIDKDIVKITGASMDPALQTLDKPRANEDDA